MKILVANKQEQEGYFCHASEGEMVRYISNPEVRVNYLIGIDSEMGVSVFTVAEVDMTEEEYINYYISKVCSGKKPLRTKERAKKDAESILAVARIHQVGDVMEYVNGAFQIRNNI